MSSLPCTPAPAAISSGVTPSLLASVGSAPRLTNSRIPSMSPTSAHFQNAVVPTAPADYSEKLYSLYQSSLDRRTLGSAPRSSKTVMSSRYDVFSYFVDGWGWNDFLAHCVFTTP